MLANHDTTNYWSRENKFSVMFVLNQQYSSHQIWYRSNFNSRAGSQEARRWPRCSNIKLRYSLIQVVLRRNFFLNNDTLLIPLTSHTDHIFFEIKVKSAPSVISLFLWKSSCSFLTVCVSVCLSGYAFQNAWTDFDETLRGRSCGHRDLAQCPYFFVQGCHMFLNAVTLQCWARFVRNFG